VYGAWLLARLARQDVPGVVFCLYKRVRRPANRWRDAGQKSPWGSSAACQASECTYISCRVSICKR
jgi:hypothetical protein